MQLRQEIRVSVQMVYILSILKDTLFLGGRLKSIFRGVTRVTLGTDLEKSCIFRRVSSLGEGEKVQIDPDKLHGLMQLLSLFEVFLIIRVHDDDEEVNCRKALELAGTLQCGLHPAKVLFCETLQGTTAIVRYEVFVVVVFCCIECWS